MTTTYEWLETYNGIGAALSLAIEGITTTFGTSTGMGDVYQTASAPFSDFDDPIGGLKVTGSLRSRIQLYAQDIDADSITFTIVDKTGALTSSLFREAYSSGHRTYLTSSVTAGSTATINVKDTTGFAASGVIYIGDETIVYSGKTATTFTGITRAAYVVNQTDSGSAFAPAHTIGNNVTTSATTSPAVTDYPRTWYGRFVHLFMHYRDPLSGAYVVASSATKLFSGRIESYRDNGDGTLSITAKSAIELLNRAVGADPWTAVLEEGIAFDSDTDQVLVGSSLAPAYNPVASLGLTGRKSHEDVAAAIQAQLNTWNAGASTRAGDMWEVSLRESNDGGPPRYQFVLYTNTTSAGSGTIIGVSLHKNMWSLLGWVDGGLEVTNPNGIPSVMRLLQLRSTNRWELRAPLPPVVYFRHNLITNEVVYASKQQGTFTTMTPSQLGVPAQDSTFNGLIQIKESSHFDGDVFSVQYTAGATATLKIIGKLDTVTGTFNTTYGPGPSSSTDPLNGEVRLGEATRAPVIKQVYYEHGPAGDVILKAMLSTGGAAGYNHATYDTFTTPTFGAAVPASLVDVSSFEELNDVTLGFIVTDAKPLIAHLEPILAVTNRYVVWKANSATENPKLTIVRPHLDNTTLTSWQLTESNKAIREGGAGRMAVERGAEGIVNRVVVKYGQGWDKTGDARTWIVEDIASQSDYGRRRTVTIDAPTVTNVEVVAPKTIGTALAYFARPLALATRSYNASLIRMAPGDSASVFDNYLVDPATGTRGAFLYGWVLDTEFDLATGIGQVRIVFLPERPPRAYKFGPSARVDETAAGAGYNSITKTLTTVQNEFSPPATTGDAASFAVGDKVHVYALDESPPLEWFDTVISTTGTTIRLLIGLAGYDTTKRYVVEYDDILTVQSSQKTSTAYIADDATLSTGGSPTTPFEWGGDALYPVDNPERVYTVGMGMPNTTYATAGEPMSVHKAHYLVKGLNALLSYKTRTVHINQYFKTPPTVTGTTTKLLFIGWVPVYGHTSFGGRGFKVRLYVKQAGGGTATYTVRSSGNKPFGSSFTSYSFKGGSESVGTSTASSTLVWTSELDLDCQAGAQFGQLAGTFITVEAVGSGGGVTATLQGIFVCEAAI